MQARGRFVLTPGCVLYALIYALIYSLNTLCSCIWSLQKSYLILLNYFVV